MNQTPLIETVAEALKTMGLNPVRNEGTDLVLDVELMDARWSTGKRTIHYRAAIYFDEARRAVFMHEQTRESGGGFSFGFQGESSTQTGRTLMRKVKSIQYGTDGKVFEYEFDLGAIPKTVAAAAAEAGWKFQTVLRRSSALWPKGYSPHGTTSPPAPLPESTSPSGSGILPPPMPPKEAQKMTVERTFGAGMAARIGLGVWTVLLILLLLAFRSNGWGWVACLLIVGVGFALQALWKHAGCMAHLGLGIATVVLSFFALSLSATRTEWSSARVEKAVVASALDESGRALQTATIFPSDISELYVSADLRQAPAGTRLRFKWIYTQDHQEIATVEMTTTEGQSDAPVFCRLSNQGGLWPEGEYRVEIFVDDRAKPDAVTVFQIGSPGHSR